MRKKRRAQAAMEFLTTYGWAFMIVLVMVAALSYFGVLNPEGFLSESCIFEPGILCRDFAGQLGTSSINMTLVNNLGKSVEILDVTVECTGVTCSACDGAAPPAGNNLCSLKQAYPGSDVQAFWPPDEVRELKQNKEG